MKETLLRTIPLRIVCWLDYLTDLVFCVFLEMTVTEYNSWQQGQDNLLVSVCSLRIVCWLDYLTNFVLCVFLETGTRHSVLWGGGILTLVIQSRATRNVPNAVAKVNALRFLLSIWKSSERPVITASMPPIYKGQSERILLHAKLS